MKFRTLPIILCLALLLAVPALADVLGTPVDGCSAVLAEGAVLTERNYWTGSDYRAEHYLTLAPECAAMPVVVSSSILWSSQSLSQASASLERKGMHVLCGTNGGFFTMSTGEPVGMIVSDGILRADNDWMEAVGFRKDGSVIYGKPQPQLQLVGDSGTAVISSLNHVSGAGLRLYSSDCAQKITPSGKSWCALCEADGSLQLGGSVTVRVTRVWENETAVSLSENQLLLVMDQTYSGAAQTFPAMLQEGAALTIRVNCASGWETVDSAVGILYPLIKNGEIVSGLDTTAAPRTAIGIKADGTLILYTIDGRQSGYSVGTGLLGVAQRLQELGCVMAGALDGGGSTRMAAQLPGFNSLSTVSKPSENRNVVNYIMVGVKAQNAETAACLTLYPLHINALSGAEIPLTVLATDRNGYPAAVPTELSYTVSGDIGQVIDNVFYASGTGSGSITVSAPGLASGTSPVRVTESPELLELYGEVYGKKTTSLTLGPGQEVDLTVKATDAHVVLTGEDCLYSWTLDPAVGSVDQNGHLIPGDVSGTGYLTAGAGTNTVSIPITVWTGVPFRDVSVKDPYFAAVKYVYEHNIFEGVSQTEFAPHTTMSRAMLVTILWRMCGKPEATAPADYTDVDADNWYGPAVAWAAETGIVKGYCTASFGPEDALTKEQIITILHRWAGLPDAEGEVNVSLENTQPYAVAAMQWALQNKLIEPDPQSGLQPGAPMDRAAVAEVLLRRSRLG